MAAPASPADYTSLQEGLPQGYIPPRPGRLGSRWWPRALTSLVCVVIGVQLAAIAAYGASVVLRSPVWSPIDEAAHVSYVDHLAREHHLPVMGKTHVSKAIFAITGRQQPRLAAAGLRHAGLGGLSYEAFQPPLYYILAVPVYDWTGGNLMHRVYALRFFGLGLLLASALLAAYLARVAAGRHWLAAWSFALIILMMPGVVVRSITVSNEALALPLTILFAAELLQTWKRRSPLRLLVTSGLLGLCLLTQTLLVALLPAFAIVVGVEIWRRRWWRGALLAVAAAVVPLAMLTPWLMFNESHFHALTADSIAISEQEHAVNPHHLRYQGGALPGELAGRVLQPVLPQEWGNYLDRHPGLEDTELAILCLLGAGGLVALAKPRLAVSGQAVVLALPLLSTLALLCAVTYFAQWNVMLARYAYPVLALWAVFAAFATERIFRQRLLLAVAAGYSTAVLGLVWSGLYGAHLA